MSRRTLNSVMLLLNAITEDLQMQLVNMQCLIKQMANRMWLNTYFNLTNHNLKARSNQTGTIAQVYLFYIKKGKKKVPPWCLPSPLSNCVFPIHFLRPPPAPTWLGAIKSCIGATHSRMIWTKNPKISVQSQTSNCQVCIQPYFFFTKWHPHETQGDSTGALPICT